MSRPLSILVAAGHPADAIDRAGGTMALHADRGDKVSAVILTAGARCHPVDLQDKLASGAAMTMDEVALEMDATAAAKVAAVRDGLAMLGVNDVYLLGEDDYALLPSVDIVRRLARIIRRVQPDIVVTHHPWDQPNYYFLDPHGVISFCTAQAVDVATRPDPDFPEEPPAPMPAQILWYMTFPFHRAHAMQDYRWDLYVDISPVAGRKAAALELIKTQHWDTYAQKYVEAAAGWAGVVARTSHAEIFARNLPELHQYLPVSEYQRRLDRLAPAESWERMSRLITSGR